MGDPASDRARAADCIGWGPKGQQFPLHQRTLCRDQGYSGQLNSPIYIYIY